MLRAPHLLHLMVASLGRAHSLGVSQVQTVYPGGTDNRTIQWEETLYYGFPDRFRVEAASAGARRIHVTAGDQAVTILDQSVVRNTETAFDRYKDLLLMRSRASLEAHLGRLGMDVTVSSLGCFGHQTVYIVGARYPDESVPQLWLDQTTFRPLRWLVGDDSAGSPSDLLEIRYLDWRPVEKFWYPYQIRFFQGDRLVGEIKTLDLELNPPLAKSLFDVDGLRAAHVRSTAPEPAAADIDDVQQVLEDFKKKYE